MVGIIVNTAQAQLLFVYNADSGLFNTLTDIAHKIFSPDTYSCALCEISHGHFHMRAEWKDFIDSLVMPTEFLHRDEARAKYRIQQPLPAIFINDGGNLTQCLSAEQISQCRTIDDLKQAVLGVCCNNRQA